MPWRAVFFRPGRSAAVARLLWEQDVAGSIPVAPTMSKGSIGFPVEPLMFKKRCTRAGGEGQGELCPFLFDDLPKEVEGVFPQSRGDSDELDHIEPAFPAFILRNIRLRRAQRGGDFHLREAVPFPCVDKDLAEPLISFSKSRLHWRTPFTSTLWEIV